MHAAYELTEMRVTLTLRLEKELRIGM